MTFGERIRNKREHLEISQTDLAKKIGVSKQTLYKYETNIITNIPSNIIENIASILNVSPAILMGWETEQTTIQKYSLPVQTLLDKSENLNTDGIKELNKYADYLLSQKQYQKIKTQEQAM